MTQLRPAVRELPELQPLWRDVQVAEYLGVDEKTLERWRRERTGPPYIRAGRQVRYRVEDVQDWLTERTTLPA
jgi:excisionase family DNA binding protein